MKIRTSVWYYHERFKISLKKVTRVKYYLILYNIQYRTSALNNVDTEKKKRIEDTDISEKSSTENVWPSFRKSNQRLDTTTY